MFQASDPILSKVAKHVRKVRYNIWHTKDTIIVETRVVT